MSEYNSRTVAFCTTLKSFSRISWAFVSSETKRSLHHKKINQFKVQFFFKMFQTLLQTFLETYSLCREMKSINLFASVPRGPLLEINSEAASPNGG